MFQADVRGSRDHVVDDPVLPRLLRGEEAVALRILGDALQGLSRHLGEEAVETIAHAQNSPRMDRDVRCLAFRPSPRLVDHDLAVGEGEAFPGVPAARRNAPMDAHIPTQIVFTGGRTNFIVS